MVPNMEGAVTVRAWAIMVPHPFLPSPQRAWPLTSMSPQPTCPLPGPSMSQRWWPGEAPYCPRMCLSPRWQHQVWVCAPIGRWGTLRLEEGPGSGVPGAAGRGGGEEALRELQHGSQAPRVGTRGEKVPRSQSLESPAPVLSPTVSAPGGKSQPVAG